MRTPPSASRPAPQPALWSIRTRLLATALGLTFAILLLVSSVGYSASSELLTQQAKQQARSLAREAALAVEVELDPLAMVPGAIAAGEQRSADGRARVDGLRQTLPALLRRLPSAQGVYLSFEPGVLEQADDFEVWYVRSGDDVAPYYSNLPANPGYDASKPLYAYRTEGWYTQAVGAAQTQWTEPYLDSASAVPMVSATGPVTVGGRLIGVAGVDVSLARVTELVGALRPTARSYALLTSREGVLIANAAWPDSALRQTLADLAGSVGEPGLVRLGEGMRQGQPGVLELRDPRSGEQAWAAFEPVHGTGWSVAVVVPQSDLLDGLAVARERALLAGALGMALLAALLHLSLNSITGPLRRLTGAAGAMTRGDLSVRVREGRRDELGALIASFNSMAETVARRTAESEAHRAAAVAARDEAEAGRGRADRQLALIEAQRAQISAMSVPVLPLSGTTLVVPLVGALDDERLRLVQSLVLGAVERARARWLILDITGVPLLDADHARRLSELAAGVGLLGGELVLVGVTPAVAQAIVAVGFGFDRMRTFGSLQQGVAYALGRDETARR